MILIVWNVGTTFNCQAFKILLKHDSKTLTSQAPILLPKCHAWLFCSIFWISLVPPPSALITRNSQYSRWTSNPINFLLIRRREGTKGGKMEARHRLGPKRTPRWVSTRRFSRKAVEQLYGQPAMLFFYYLISYRPRRISKAFVSCCYDSYSCRSLLSSGSAWQLTPEHVILGVSCNAVQVSFVSVNGHIQGV